jgi:hypothetical protein
MPTMQQIDRAQVRFRGNHQVGHVAHRAAFRFVEVERSDSFNAAAIFAAVFNRRSRSPLTNRAIISGRTPAAWAVA